MSWKQYYSINDFTEEWRVQIADYLFENPDYFCNKNSVDVIGEVQHFKLRSPNYIIFENEFLMCDFYCNEMWVCCYISKKRYDKIRKDWFNLKPILKITVDCSGKFPCFNGYWKIPEVPDLHERVQTIENKIEIDNVD